MVGKSPKQRVFWHTALKILHIYPKPFTNHLNTICLPIKNLLKPLRIFENILQTINRHSPAYCFYIYSIRLFSLLFYPATVFCHFILLLYAVILPLYPAALSIIVSCCLFLLLCAVIIYCRFILLLYPATLSVLSCYF